MTTYSLSIKKKKGKYNFSTREMDAEDIRQLRLKVIRSKILDDPSVDYVSIMRLGKKYMYPQGSMSKDMFIYRWTTMDAENYPDIRNIDMRTGNISRRS